MARRSFVDLHCHTSASFDSLASPAAVVRAAADRGLTHLAITDHDRIDGALAAAKAAAEQGMGLHIVVGEEVRTLDGDLICLFLERAVPPGRPATETIARVRDQGGLVGIPHPFDRYRGSLLRETRTEALGPLVDWIEIHNARIVLGDGNQRAAELAASTGLPGVAVSDAHSVLEIGVAYTAMGGEPGTPAGLLAALRGPDVDHVTGRATIFVRAVTPLAKVVQRVRGNGRIRPTSAGDPTTVAR